MKLLLQRVSQASVTVGEETVASIGRGLLLFVCAEPGDDEAAVSWLARKAANLRVFADANGKMNLSLRQIGGTALAVSQFTLAADVRKGNRPSFAGAATADAGEALYLQFCAALSAQGVPVHSGCFGASMQVSLVNDGPVTLWLDSAIRRGALPPG